MSFYYHNTSCIILSFLYNKIEMGVRQSLEAQGEEIRECEWQAAGEKERSFGRWCTLRNRRTGAMVDEYQLSWANEQEYRFYLKSFNWRHRRRNLAPVVTSISLRPICSGQGCSGKYAANVYLEHAALRLSQIEDVPIVDSLFILGEALEGYLQLYVHSGYFQVHADQVCFDRAGRVKVWVNSDLSCNYPETNPECGHKDEVDMVEQLVRIANEVTDGQEMPTPSIEEYFDMVRRREEVQIGFEYAKLVVIEYARLHQIKPSSRFDAVIDLFSNSHIEPPKHYNPSTLPSSQTFIMHPHQQHPSLSSMPRLNTCQSLPNFQPNTNFSTLSYQPPQNLHYAPVLARPQSSPYLQPYVQRSQLPAIPRLQQLNMSQFGEASVQTKRKSRNSKTSKNSKSQMVCQEETTQNQSINFIESHADDRNTMKSMPLRNPYNTHRDRFANSQRVRYSECDQEIFSQNQQEYSRPFNHHDAFGLASPPHRRMNESSTSYRLPSSNSSQSKQRHSKQSNNSSSRRQSIRNDHNQSYYYNDRNQWNQREDWPEARRGSRRERNQRLYAMQMSQPIRYRPMVVAEEWQLDPQIEADIRKYLG